MYAKLTGGGARYGEDGKFGSSNYRIAINRLRKDERKLHVPKPKPLQMTDKMRDAWECRPIDAADTSVYEQAIYADVTGADGEPICDLAEEAYANPEVVCYRHRKWANEQ